MIIAEIGQNFTGNMPLARKLIKLAKENGADLVKFQLYDTDALYQPNTKLYDLAKQAELSWAQASHLFNYGKEIGIEVFFSVFNVERVQWCEKIGVRRYKIAYSMRKKVSLVESINATGKPLMLSTDTLGNIAIAHNSPCWLLYCKPEYPTELRSLNFEEVDYGIYAGFSDHTIGLDCAKIALARGAWIIEKHFAIDHKTGVDAEWSMTPKELRELKHFADIVGQVL